MAGKSSKAVAKYQDKGTHNRRCGLCTMFRSPSSCTAVVGPISAQAVCRYFERKEKA